MPGPHGTRLLTATWIAVAIGIAQSLFWVEAPRWVAAILYAGISFYILPYLSEMQAALGSANVQLILAGGVAYTLGGFAYGLKRPDPFPQIFGYHEIFHLLVIIAATCHFFVVAHLILH